MAFRFEFFLVISRAKRRLARINLSEKRIAVRSLRIRIMGARRKGQVDKPFADCIQNAAGRPPCLGHALMSGAVSRFAGPESRTRSVS